MRQRRRKKWLKQLCEAPMTMRKPADRIRRLLEAHHLPIEDVFVYEHARYNLSAEAVLSAAITKYGDPGAKRCIRCKYFEDRDEVMRGFGLCRYNPPRKDSHGDPSQIWPVVMHIDWCGKYERAS